MAQECKHAHGTLERLTGTRTPQEGSYSLEIVNPADSSKGKSQLCRRMCTQPNLGALLWQLLCFLH